MKSGDAINRVSTQVQRKSRLLRKSQEAFVVLSYINSTNPDSVNEQHYLSS